MERLTYGLGSYNRTYGLVDKASAKPGLFTDYDGFYANLLAHHRLGQYEDILFDADGKELVSVEHLTELVKAMEEGRLVELPCKVGDTVYIADRWGKKVDEFQVNWFTFDGEKIMCWEHRDLQPITPDIWGKTVFLTRQEAEAALHGGGEGE